jgi:uncharacterized protein
MTLLILHGLYGNGPDHWQVWLAREAAAAGFDVCSPELPDPDTPTPGGWLAALDAALDQLQPAALQVAAHSLSCHLWSLRADRGDLAAARVLLVAPPAGPELAEVCPTFPATPLTAGPLLAACPDTTVVLGAGDPYRGDAVFRSTGLPTTLVPDGAHLNVDAGFGPWPHALRWVLGGDPPGAPLPDQSSSSREAV